MLDSILVKPFKLGDNGATEPVYTHTHTDIYIYIDTPHIDSQTARHGHPQTLEIYSILLK